MKKFIKKHPWLLFKCIALTMWVCGFLARQLNKSMLLLLDLKGKDPNWTPPPPPPPPEPVKERAQLKIPWMPPWVGPLMRRGGLSNHPVLRVRAEYEAKQKALEEAKKAPLAPTVVTEVGGDAVNSLREAIGQIETAVIPEQPARRSFKKKSVKNKG